MFFLLPPPFLFLPLLRPDAAKSPFPLLVREEKGGELGDDEGCRFPNMKVGLGFSEGKGKATKADTESMVA